VLQEVPLVEGVIDAKKKRLKRSMKRSIKRSIKRRMRGD
jgi:hypothetical protein